jgi:hypothetical protein
MRLFRSTRLQRIVIFLLLVLLSAGPIDFSEQQWDGKDEIVICSAQCLAELSSPLRQHQNSCKFDVAHIAVLPNLIKIISVEYILGTSFDSISTDLLPNPDRGPPPIITIL